MCALLLEVGEEITIGSKADEFIFFGEKYTNGAGKKVEQSEEIRKEVMCACVCVLASFNDEDGKQPK